MQKLTNKKWWMDTGTRAVKTMAQSALAIIGTEAFLSGVNWVSVISAALLSGVVSVLMNIALLPDVEEE